MDEDAPLPLNEQETALELRGRQRALYEGLSERNELLSNMYIGSLLVLNQRENPDRLALASHNLRELMEKLPRYLDFPTELQVSKTTPGSIKPKVQILFSEWIKTKSKSACRTERDWSGNIDRPLQIFLKKWEEFIEWFEREMPAVVEETRRFLEQFDPMASRLPLTISSLRASEWKAFRDYFVGTAHHRSGTQEEEFSQWLESFESFLIDRLRPRTFADFAKIDALISGDTPDAR
jgi:hypothetical protein